METLEIRQLSVFDEIYKTRSVSRAAENLGLGQPAVSIALGKLREHFADPLFVRTSAGMEPTPLGEELAEPIRVAVTAVAAASGHRAEFDPTRARRTFRLAMTDISQLVLLPRLWERLRTVAPGIHIDIANLSASTAAMLESGEVDVALGFMPQLEAGFYQQALFRPHYVCMASATHPRIRGGLTLAQFEAEEHAVVSTSGTGHLIIDREIARQDIKRRVVLRIPSFVGIAYVVERTALLVTIPQRLGELLADEERLRVYPVPFALPEYAVKQHWHERYNNDPGNRWLRALIQELLSTSLAP
ncbi:LysR family transcriptional regulator [Azoarcus sp. PA01]|nr:LysR family transcriptional regulator [Azoarcus sp. PA01]